MCYTVSQLTKREVAYAKRAATDEAEIKRLEKELRELSMPPLFHVSGFAHPDLLCFTHADGPNFSPMRWGLVPSWVKDAAQAAQLSKQTLNARGESIFEKPSFRHAAAKNRCLVLVDGFFEFHHLGKRTFPFHIRMKSGEPMALGGLYEHWRGPDGIALTTVSIVTTEANALMRHIHNNPKAEGPRMPFIVPRGVDEEWLGSGADKDRITSLIQPYDEDALEAYTVPALLGKQAIGNVKEAVEPFSYPELGLFQ
jgi:putative SOS response-associated peptidase YedK